MTSYPRLEQPKENFIESEDYFGGNNEERKGATGYEAQYNMHYQQQNSDNQQQMKHSSSLAAAQKNDEMS